MRRSTISHIQKSIAEKSLNLEQWLETCPVDERETCLAEAAEQDGDRDLNDETSGAGVEISEGREVHVNLFYCANWQFALPNLCF